MRRILAPPTSLLLILVSLFLAPGLGAGQIRVSTTASLLSNSSRVLATKLSATVWPNRTVTQPATWSKSIDYNSVRSFTGNRIKDGRQLAANMQLQSANAETKPHDIAPQSEPSVAMFDWRQLRSWHIAGVISLCVLEALLIVGLLLSRRRRRQAEQENEQLARVAEAERRHLNEFVSNVPGIVWEGGYEPGTNIGRSSFVSDYVEKMLGYSVEEWLATPNFPLTIIPEEDRERVASEAQALYESATPGSFQFRWLTKDGRVLWVQSQIAPVCDGAGKTIGLRGVTLDITDRKLAEESLRQSEERNRAILRALPDLMFLQNREGKFLDYHVSNPRDLYLPPAAFLGKNIREVLPPELAESFISSFARAEQTGEPQILEYSLPIQGEHRWYEARIVLSDGDKLVSIVRDVTESHLARENLRLSDERFAKAFRANPQSMSVSRLADGIFLDVNDSFLNMTGHRREDVIGRSSLELGIWDTPDVRKELTQLLKQKGAINNLETSFRNKSGSVRLILLSAEQIELDGEKCVLTASSDITERLRAVEELRQSEERFRNMADTAPIMIWISGPDKRCTYFNQRWLEFTGRTMEQELGEGWSEGVHEEDFEGCLNAYASAFNRRESFSMEYRLRRADGIYRWVFDTGTPRLSSSGEFLGYIGSCLDVTDRKQMETDLQLALKEVSDLKNQLQEENIYLKEEIKLEHNFHEIVGQSDEIKYTQFKIEQVAQTDSTVIIMGETGTGKELVARAIHEAGPRKDRPLVKVNCATLPASLIESELFGHERGAFTGAHARKLGRFETANGATLFLDEVGELPIELQPKLLRVLQEGEFERVGGSKTIQVDVRIIAATNRNLMAEIQKGLFREDLWYRLSVFPITVQPLRQRKSDIPLLVNYFVAKFSRKLGKSITSISPTALRALENYSWPGNVRELANVIERAAINSQGPALHLADRLDDGVLPSTGNGSETLVYVERTHILKVLESTRWKIEGNHGAARILGLNPSTLRTRMAKLRIQRPDEPLREPDNDRKLSSFHLDSR